MINRSLVQPLSLECLIWKHISSSKFSIYIDNYTNNNHRCMSLIYYYKTSRLHKLWYKMFYLVQIENIVSWFHFFLNPCISYLFGIRWHCVTLVYVALFVILGKSLYLFKCYSLLILLISYGYFASKLAYVRKIVMVT